MRLPRTLRFLYDAIHQRVFSFTFSDHVQTTDLRFSRFARDLGGGAARPRLAGVARRDGRRPKTKRSARARCRNRQPHSCTLAQASCKTLRKRLARAERVLVGKSVWAITYTLLPLGIAVAYQAWVRKSANHQKIPPRCRGPASSGRTTDIDLTFSSVCLLPVRCLSWGKNILFVLDAVPRQLIQACHPALALLLTVEGR